MALGMSVGEAFDWTSNNEGGKNLIFTATDLTYTPSPNPYEILSGVNRIIIDKSAECYENCGVLDSLPHFNGGIKLAKDATLYFDFKGAKSIHTDEWGEHPYRQNFYFGSSSSSNLEEKQLINNGENGEINFILRPSAHTTFAGGIENRGNINVDIQTDSEANIRNLTTSEGAKTIFNISNSFAGIGIGVDIENYGETILNYNNIKFSSIDSQQRSKK